MLNVSSSKLNPQKKYESCLRVRNTVSYITNWQRKYISGGELCWFASPSTAVKWHIHSFNVAIWHASGTVIRFKTSARQFRHVGTAKCKWKRKCADARRKVLAIRIIFQFIFTKRCRLTHPQTHLSFHRRLYLQKNKWKKKDKQQYLSVSNYLEETFLSFPDTPNLWPYTPTLLIVTGYTPGCSFHF